MFPLGLGLSVENINEEFLVPPYPNLDTDGLADFALPQGQQPVPIHVKEASTEGQLLGYSDACANSKKWSAANKDDADWNRIKGEFNNTISALAAIP